MNEFHHRIIALLKQPNPYPGKFRPEREFEP